MKKIPIGIDTFPTLIRECCYVDKTLFLKDLIDLPHTASLLLTRPRRFGKSLMISTIRSYFDLEEPEQGLFDGLSISSTGEAYQKEKHRYCVIDLSFKNLSASSEEELLRLIGNIVGKEYRRHNKLLQESERLSQEERSYCAKMTSNQGEKSDLLVSLGNLITFLADASSREVIILLDEYDGILQAAFEGGFYAEMLGFCKVFYGVIKGNEHIRFAFITGVFEVAKESLSSSLNNPDVYTVMDDRYSQYFGFTYEEAKTLLSEYGFESSYEKALAWYGGYKMGSTEIVNPWALLKFISRGGQYLPYWTNTSSSVIFQTVTRNLSHESLSQLNALLNGEKVASEIDPTVTFLSLSSSASSTLSTLAFLGYLAIAERYEESYLCDLAIPNEEVRLIFKKEILDNAHLGGTPSALTFRTLIKNGDAEGLTRFFTSTILPSLSYYDFSKESSYQSLVLGMAGLCFDDFAIESEVNSGDRRCDILMTPKKDGDIGIIMELKSLKRLPSSSRFLISAKDALTQIKQKGYAEKLRQKEVKRIFCFGVSFCKKRSMIVFEELHVE